MSDMDTFDYVFFDRPLAESFAEQLNQQGIQASVLAVAETGEETVCEVQVRQALTDEQMDMVEALYDQRFFEDQAALIEGNDGGAQADVCGVQLRLSSGDYTTVAIDPEIMNRLLSVLSIEEIQAFLHQVAEDIEHPKTGPVCQRLPQNEGRQ
ncbi:hypothetical protein [Hydrogenovibrio halophilus]|uniref:hypothetical protein n=1 Tax=Hydrogenovibrio halophilus TaxID=373391 RepID=UPI001FDF8965|nr:hypothetical protein [Hydrogenovibrio halophilus]